MVKGERNFTENDIRELHKMILKEPYSTNAITPSGQQVQKQIKLGEYKDMPNHVKTKTGEMHYYATREETPLKMADLMKWYSEAFKIDEIHPLVLASLFHHKFVEIHPFDDGNGRLGRILMNFILMRKKLPPIVVRQEDRENYYSVLSQADVGENLPLVEYLGEELKRSLDIQLKGAKGEDISEKSDLDKEIALLKGSLKDDNLKIRKSAEAVNEALQRSIIPIFKEFEKKANNFDELFFEKKQKVNFQKIIDGTNHLKKLDIDFSIESLQTILTSKGVPDGLCFSYDLIEFKNKNSPFDLEISILVHFKKYEYVINEWDYDGLSIVKKYHEDISENERNEFIYYFVKRFIIDEIKKKVKNQE